MFRINYDADDEHWITVNGARVKVEEGQTNEEAGKAFVAEKEKSKSSDTVSKEVAKIIGREYKGVKGERAIEKLLEERQGHVKGAFYRKEIGSIDLLWGDNTRGLQKIINQRESEGFDGESFLREIPNVIRNGRLTKQSNGRYLLSQKDKRAVISPELLNDKVNFLLTAYERY